ncbi:MAG: polysaccharide pyruvyl transferase family protein [Acetatifactor sp.]
MKVVLLGLEFFINNLGCEALSYSFVSELYKTACEREEQIEVTTVVFADQKTPYIPGTDISIKCLGIHYKSPSFWKILKKELKSADLIVDFTMGDSFSDIYGIKRFVLDALVKTAAVRSSTPFLLGPQTYGPYGNSLVRKWARWILKRAYLVYARDEQSRKVAEELSGREVILTTDVAFALPYEKQELGATDRVRVGFNPSGLLWAGGYTHDNQFGLTIDYQQYCWKICEWLSGNPRFEVFLIPHVGTSDKGNGGEENDCEVCRLIQRKYPEMKILDEINTPMDIKGYLAAMDVFIGARMHATIGAFSGGAATIPVSYSRKFEGLYGSLGYDYVIHALQYSTEEAVNKTISYIEGYQKLQAAATESMKLVEKKQTVFREGLAKCMVKLQ